jgi:LPPG:FO 2-phospho-L-lactate transferase
MKVTALAGGIGAGKLLRGLVRAVPPADVTVIVNTGDDVDMHGLHVSPDLDSITYWLGDAFDRERGWGRRDESFRATEELRRFDPDMAWFNLGDLDLATHLFRSNLLREGLTLSGATARVAARFGLECRLLPMSDERVTTRVVVVADGRELDLHFQEYWVRRRARDEVKAVRYEGADAASPAPGVLEAVSSADAVLLCPSNPVASIGPILAVPGIREALAARARDVVGISGIVRGAPLAGMADKLMPVAGVEVTAAGAAAFYAGLLGSWVIDEADRGLAARIEATGVRVGVTDTIMRDDAASEALARFALDRLREPRAG